MKKKIILLTAFAILLPAVSSAQPDRVPRGAYIRKQVGSVDELALHITSDPIVRNRFARHFGVAPDRLSEYVKDNVTITRVGSSTPSKVYVVKRDGRMVAERKTLKRGTQVFALKDTGEPLLVLSCGNPVMKQLPPRVKVKSSGAQVYQVMRPNELPPPTLPPPLVAAPPPVIQAQPVPSPSPVVPPVIAPPTALPPVAVAGKPNLLPLLPLLGLFAGGGGDNGNTETPGVVPPPPVPEPGGAAAVVATAFLPAAGWVLRKYRSGRMKNGLHGSC